MIDRDLFDASRLGLEHAAMLTQLYRGKINWEQGRRLIDNSGVMSALANGGDASFAAQAGIEEFLRPSEKYLINR